MGHYPSKPAYFQQRHASALAVRFLQFPSVRRKRRRRRTAVLGLSDPAVLLAEHQRSGHPAVSTLRLNPESSSLKEMTASPAGRGSAPQRMGIGWMPLPSIGCRRRRMTRLLQARAHTDHPGLDPVDAGGGGDIEHVMFRPAPSHVRCLLRNGNGAQELALGR
jgi:hypothetical protein